MILKENETLEDLLIDGLKIIQNINLYRFSSDAVLLSKFASYKKGDTVADFCAGSGIVGMHFYALNKGVNRVDGYEIQRELADTFMRSIEYNGLEDKIFCYNMPIQEIGKEKNGEYSLILCNPPYKKKNSGGTNPEGHIAICRHEIAVTLDEIISVSAKKLKHGGRLAMCQRVERLTDMLEAMRRNKIEPYKLQFVTSGDEQKPYLFLVEGVKGVCRQLTVLETIRN
ncbi:MAG: methyltransferase [Clostridia bacterium]|nr:methyltransferase [Clostridia bacterium]